MFSTKGWSTEKPLLESFILKLLEPRRPAWTAVYFSALLLSGSCSFLNCNPGIVSGGSPGCRQWVVAVGKLYADYFNLTRSPRSRPVASPRLLLPSVSSSGP